MENEPKRKIINNLKKKVFDHWIIFNVFTLFWILVVLSVLFVFEHGILFYISIFVAFGLSYLIMDIKYNVAEKTPNTFLKFEEVNRFISKIFWRFIYPAAIALFIFYLLFSLKYPSITKEASPISTPIFVVFFTVFIGTAVYQIAMIGNVRQQPRFLKVRAEAYFRETARQIKNPPIKKHGRMAIFLLSIFSNKKREDIEQRQKLIRMFESGMNDLNAFLINQFNLEFSNLRKYIDYFHYIICFEKCNELERVRKVIEIMGYNLGKKLSFQI
jgi:hypothetical protein